MKFGKQKKNEVVKKEEKSFLVRNKKNIKDIIAPAGVDATHTNHLEIVSSTTKYARSVIISTMPRMCTFPEFLRSMYTFGDANISVFIKPVSENSSQTDLNRRINEIESERIVAAERGNINRERILAQKRLEAEELRDSIAGGFNKLYESSVICTLFAYSLEDLDKQTELLSTEMSKTLIGIKPTWAMQEEAFNSNMPY